jgi:hypothetical protein
LSTIIAVNIYQKVNSNEKPSLSAVPGNHHNETNRNHRYNKIFCVKIKGRSFSFSKRVLVQFKDTKISGILLKDLLKYWLSRELIVEISDALFFSKQVLSWKNK